jgi:hypothetical protein
VPQRFPARVVDAVDEAKILGIRAGKGDHRIIGIWAVVVDGRIFVRSWGLKESGWYKTFLEEPSGIMQVGERLVRVRAVPARNERLKAAVSAAYRAKYNTPGSRKFVDGFERSKRRRDTTTELVPAASRKKRSP